MKKNILKYTLATLLIMMMLPFTALAETFGFSSYEGSSVLNPIAAYSSESESEADAVYEAVDYNRDNGSLYSVNNETGKLNIIPISEIDKSKKYSSYSLKSKDVDFKGEVLKYIKDKGLPKFNYGYVSSLNVSETLGTVAFSVVSEDHKSPGLIVFTDFDGKVKKLINSVNRPGSLVFSGNSRYLLVSASGKAQEENMDLKGSVTVIFIESNISNILDKDIKSIGFEAFDKNRDNLVKSGVLIKKGSKPSTDFEPSQISVDDANRYAYVTLPKNNSVAVLDLRKLSFESINPVGYTKISVDGSEVGLGNKKIEMSALRMPNGISTFTFNGETYLITANKGFDAGKANTDLIEEVSGVNVIKKSQIDGLEANKDFVPGTGTISIFKAGRHGLELFYDSSEELNKVSKKEFFSAEEMVKSKFNPGPDTVKIGTQRGRLFAFVTLKNAGGIATFDITDPNKVTLESYIDTRDYSDKISGDVTPTGTVFISAHAGPKSFPLVSTSFGKSGTIGLFEFKLIPNKQNK